MPPSVYRNPSCSMGTLPSILESDESTMSLNVDAKTQSSGSSDENSFEKPLSRSRLSYFATLRLKAFYWMVEIANSPVLKSLVGMLLFCNLVYPLAEFLRCTALPKDYDVRLLEVEPFVMISVGFRLCILAGLPHLILLVFGCGVLADSKLIYQLALDVFVWVTNLFCWSYALATIDEWTDDNIVVLSVCGLLSSIQINTFLAIHAALAPLTAPSSSEKYVSVSVVETIINKSGIRDICKQILKDDITWITPRGHFGKVDAFQYAQRVILWMDRWNASPDTTPKEKKRLKLLLDNIRWCNLLRRSLVGGEVDYADIDSSETVIATLVTAVKHLISGQKIKFALLVFFLGIQAITKFWKNYLVGLLVDSATLLGRNNEGDRSDFQWGLLWVALLVLGNILTYYLTSALGSSLVSTARARLQREMGEQVLYGGSKFGETWNMGTLTNIFNSNLTKEETVWISVMFKLVLPVWHLASAVTFFCLINTGYAIFCISVIPMVFTLKSIMEHQATTASEKFTKSSAQLAGRFQNLLVCRKAAELFESQSFLLKKFEERVHRTKDDSFESVLWGMIFASSFNSTGTFLLLVTTVVLLVALSTGKITAGEMFALTQFVTSMINPLEQLGSVSGKVAYQSGAVRSIEKLLQHDPGYDTSDDGYSASDDSIAASTEALELTLTKELTFEQVQFRYQEDSPLVLRDVTSSIPAGSYVCVFGESGSGKSTLLSLLQGSQKATGGRICMDGVDIASVALASLRSQLAVVFQETYVLDGTIKENILFGYATNMSEQEIQEAVEGAAKDAQIHDFIMKLPKKYETLLGNEEAATSLSGGQLQRICGLARALVCAPKLLLLDECTAALDTISEKAVIDSVVKLSKEKGVTIVSITHHPVTAKEADNILTLKNGFVDQSGTYDRLISQPGLFAELAEAGGHGSSMMASSSTFFLGDDELGLLKRNQHPSQTPDESDNV